MSRINYVLALLLTVAAFAADGAFDAASGGIDGCWSSVTANAGVVLVCPMGDGDPLTAPIGGGNCQITLTVRGIGGPIAGLPATDMWLVGCNDGLLLCGGTQGANADAVTDASGVTTFSNDPVAGGCDTGLWAVVQGVVVTDLDRCSPTRLPIAARSPDYKSSGGPGTSPCSGDIRCPDGRVSNADFSWFVTHFPTGANPGVTYLACADYAAPLGAIGLADFARFTVHFAGAGHRCLI